MSQNPPSRLLLSLRCSIDVPAPFLAVRQMFLFLEQTGWQLSQGERSRVFLARALLQSSDPVILDESFAALDPKNPRQAMECTLGRAKSLMVVAHV